jgi:hypothetical protein
MKKVTGKYGLTELKVTVAEQAKAVAVLTFDAVSAPRYASWTAVAAMLLRRGLSPLQAQAVMVSKWTRWARDAADDRRRVREGGYTAADLRRWMDNPRNRVSKATIEKLTEETFGYRA